MLGSAARCHWRLCTSQLHRLTDFLDHTVPLQSEVLLKPPHWPCRCLSWTSLSIPQNKHIVSLVTHEAGFHFCTFQCLFPSWGAQKNPQSSSRSTGCLQELGQEIPLPLHRSAMLMSRAHTALV